MNWSLNGDISSHIIKKDKLLSSRRLFFLDVDTSFSTLDECMQYCDETVGGRVPSIVTQEEYEEVMDFLSGFWIVWLSVRYSDHK